MKLRYLGLMTVLVMLAGCSDDDGMRSPDRGESGVSFVLDPNVTYQTIAGFGGANGVFRPQSFPDADEAKVAFGISNDEELGLSIFRIK